MYPCLYGTQYGDDQTEGHGDDAEAAHMVVFRHHSSAKGEEGLGPGQEEQAFDHHAGGQ